MSGEKIILKGRGLIGGIAEGEALVSKESMVWAHGVVPTTGYVNDKRITIYGQCIKDKILIYPLGKGSTTSSAWMLETTRNGNAPKAIINHQTELIILSGAVLSEALYNVNIPVVDHLDQIPDDVIESGDWVKVDGTTGIVEVTKR